MRLSMSIIAALAAMQSASITSAEETDGWATVHSLPQDAPQVRNALRIGGDNLFWNGKAVSEEQLEILLEALASTLSPQPLLVLSYDTNVAPDTVDRIRAMIERRIDCTPSICLDMGLSA